MPGSRFAHTQMVKVRSAIYYGKLRMPYVVIIVEFIVLAVLFRQWRTAKKNRFVYVINALGSIVLAGIALLFIVRAPYAETVAPADLTDEQAIDAARAYAHTHQLTKLKEDCISGSMSRTSSTSAIVDLREVHDSLCGGDPDTAPLITSLSVDMHTGMITPERGADAVPDYEQ